MAIPKSVNGNELAFTNNQVNSGTINLNSIQKIGQFRNLFDLIESDTIDYIMVSHPKLYVDAQNRWKTLSSLN